MRTLVEKATDVIASDAAAFLTGLEREFGPRRRELLARRAERFQRLRAGELPCFPPETAAIRAGDWNVGPLPDRGAVTTGVPFMRA